MTVTALNEPLVAAIPAPNPPALPDGRLLSEVDPELYAAWRTHISQGFANNNVMFARVLNAFLYPYWLTVALYVALVIVGVGLFLLGVWLAVGGSQPMFGVISGGLGVAVLLTFFVSRPLQALEENLQFITWLGVIYNTYWSQLAVANDGTTVKQDLKDATQDTIGQIKELLQQHAAAQDKRFKLTQ
jgi:hypothetical protein